ncbi:hypothetical protein B0A53_00222 [Rhodotorula sp. CCFEE 5036]|nr:hypothetical protein B0A53_00222 [Rhodotorula sp. CCFEE 5036]
MANTTRAGALSIHGTNPQYLVPTVIRKRVYDTLYWKEKCFALNAATIIDRAVELEAVGGTYANTRPTEFICLVLKLLQLQPEREIVLEYLRAEEFKYLRALAAFYVRLTFDSLNAYETLEPLLDDYRKLRYRAMDGSYSILTMDEFVDQLLVGESVCEIQLPRLTQRKVLEETEGLAPRRSKLGKALGVMQVEGADGSDVGGGDDDDSADEEGGGGGGGRGRYLSRSPSASPSPSPSGDERADRKEGSPEYWTEASEDEDEQDSPGRRRRRRKRPVVVERGEGQGEGSDDEDAGRYISRSPSPAGSDGRFVSRSPTRSPEPERIQVEHIEGDV